MTLRMPGVTYAGPPDANYGGTVRRPPKGLVVHIAEGSYQGTISWQRNPVSDVSSHFVTDDQSNAFVQLLDLDLPAWTQAAGNPDWVSVENAGFHTGSLAAGQIEACAQIFAFTVRTWPSIPYQVTNSPDVPGLGWHGMGGAAWGSHFDCPGPNNVALLPVILNRAIAINGGSGGVPMGVQMLVRFTDAPAEAGGPNQVWICDGMFRRKVAQSLANGQSVTDGGIGNNGTHAPSMLGELGNSGQVFASGPGGWAGRDAWGIDIAALGGGGAPVLVAHTHDGGQTGPAVPAP